jgi:hypothetical protein
MKEFMDISLYIPYEVSYNRMLKSHLEGLLIHRVWLDKKKGILRLGIAISPSWETSPT